MQIIQKLMAALGQNGYTVGLQRVQSGYLLKLLDRELDRESSFGFTEAEADEIAQLVARQYCTADQFERLLDPYAVCALPPEQS